VARTVRETGVHRFTPVAYQGPGSVNGWGDITEGFTVQYTWYVPQDVQGYMKRSWRRLVPQTVGELFTVELPDDIPGAHDIQGRIGAIGMEMNLAIM
jgi:hypothetical protein